MKAATYDSSIFVTMRKADYTDEPALLAFLETIDHSFDPPLSSRVQLGQWTRKVLDLGTVMVAGEGRKFQGVIAFYCNDKETKRAFISLLGVVESARRQGIGRSLLGEAINICGREGMKSAVVTTEANNRAAVALYETMGFSLDPEETGRTGKTVLRLLL